MGFFTVRLFGIGLALAACSGCAADSAGRSSQLWSWGQGKKAAPPAAGATSDAAAAVDSAAGPNKAPAGLGTAAASAGQPPGAVDAKAILAVLAQLKGAGAIDDDTQQRLIDDLQQTDPALWPQMLDVFRASLAYRQKYVDEPNGSHQLAADATRRAAPGQRSPDAQRDGDRAKPLDRTADSPGQRQTQPLATAESAAQPDSVQLASAVVPIDPPVVATPSAPAAAAGSAKDGSAQAGAAQATVVAAAPAAEPDRLDWRGHLQAAIEGLESETTEPPATTAAIGRHAGLRLLYVLDGRRDAALKPIAGIPPTQQDFWSNEIFGLTTFLDADRNADESRRAAAACVALREAGAKLGELATLTVRNLAFCNEVHSFGVYKKFAKYDFQPGQEVLLYAEVENFKSLPTEKGFHTALKSSYQILDQHGARVDQKEFEITAEDCLNARRDYFIRYFVWMPKRIYGGTYTLQLTIEDTHSQKIGQSSIEFTINEKDQ
jgi:hypothetical protein